MSTAHALTLPGCSPVPLAHYLKALGILRLVSEQKDASATGHWQRDQFVLTSSLDREGLLKFFLEEYRPTPIMVPWSGGDYFSVNLTSPTSSFDSTPTASRVIEALLSSKTEKLSGYRSAIFQVFSALTRAEVSKKKDIEGSGTAQRKAKTDLLQQIRSTLSDSVVEWVDTAAIIESQSLAFNTLLGGGGGSDGNSHFSDNFMQCLWMTLSDFDDQRKKPIPALGCKTGFNTLSALKESISNIASKGTKIRDLSPVLFDSSRVGGVNQSSGFEGVTASNPWDFILMMEGSILFAGSIGRKLQSTQEGSARFPFLFTSTSSGLGASYLGESSGKEMWMPLWSRASLLSELKVVLSEGRIEKFGKPAKHGVDAFVGISQLGYDRGINEFRRIGFYKGRVGGDNYFTAIDRGSVKPKKSQSTDNLKDCHLWIDHFRKAALKDDAPASASSSLSSLELSIINLCKNDSAINQMAVLIALGRCQAVASRSLKWCKKNSLLPLFGLRKAWVVDNWNDGRHGTEFRLAASLASVSGKFGKDWLPLRCHLEQVDSFVGKGSSSLVYRWGDVATNNVQWSQASLPAVLNDVFARRLILNETPPRTRSEVWASLADIKAFIEGGTDDALLSDLLWSMSLINWRDDAKLPERDHERVVPPTFYSLLKGCFPPVLEKLPEGILKVPVVPAIHKHAAQGNGNQAAELAVRRLRSSGYHPLLRQMSVQGEHARRSAAALLFPISDTAQKALIKQITRPDKESENKTEVA